MPPLRYFVPNSLTALSLVIGLGSIAMSAEGSFRLAAWMILWGVLLDKLDGTAARLFKATSKFGVEFDSFADFVIFGIAPAALIYYRLLSMGDLHGWPKPALMGAAGAYALALAIRLARFNVTTGGETVFFGLPGTLVGALIAASFLTWQKYGLSEGFLAYSPVVLIIDVVLMVSTLRLPKLKLRKSKALNILTIGNVAAVYVLTPLMLFPEYLLGVALLYTVVGVTWCLLHPDASTHAESEPVATASEQGEEAREHAA